MKKLLNILIYLVFISFSLFAQGTKENTTYKYATSTAWTAAFAQLGGLDNVCNIAPANLVHPPEYEIVPSDILKIKNSKLFIFAGYEAMMKTLSKNIIDESNMLKIMTKNDLENVKRTAAIISEREGTQKLSSKRVQKYENLILESRKIVKQKGLDKFSVYIQFHLVPMAKDLGLNIKGIYGPSPINSKEIKNAYDNQYDLIIDNIHMPQSKALKEVSPSSKVISWRNFPSTIEEDALYNMMKENIDKLLNIK